MVKCTPITCFLLLCLLVYGRRCGNRFDIPPRPPESITLIDSFASECSKRGIKVDVSPASLEVSFGRITSKAGSCKPNSHPKKITIDSMLWKALSPPVREMLVYHEWAHCLLKRKHTNEVLASGECKSWMREDDHVCKINSINPKWREYYIEEFFSAENLTKPEWYEFDPHQDFIQTNVTPGKIIMTKFNSLLFDSSFFSGPNDWRIELLLEEPKKLQGYFNIKINKYAVQLVGFTSFADTSKSVFIKTMILDQFKFRPDKNFLFTDT